MLPNFLLIGATKCATTSLWALLKEHPQVFMCHPKEPQFFSNPEYYARGLDWYESLFAHANDALAVGEASANYANSLYSESAARRIYQLLPGARLIYCVRHPLRRIESAWVHVRCRLYTAAERTRGLRPAPANFYRALRHSTVGRDVLETSLFWRQLNRFRRFFPDERIHICFFEDFQQDQMDVARGCFQFLGVDPLVGLPSQSRHLNASTHKQQPTWLYQNLARFPLLDRLAERLPAQLKWRPAQHPVWTRQASEFVTSVVREDAMQLLDYCRRSPDFWRFDDPFQNSSYQPASASPLPAGTSPSNPAAAC